jgi:hypothetical protein
MEVRREHSNGEDEERGYFESEWKKHIQVIDST